MLRDPWHCEGNATGKGSCQTGTMYYGTCLRALLRNTFYMDLQSAAVFPDVLYVAITYFMRYLSRSTGVYGVIGHLSTFTAVCIKLDSASTRRKKKKIPPTSPPPPGEVRQSDNARDLGAGSSAHVPSQKRRAELARANGDSYRS